MTTGTDDATADADADADDPDAVFEAAVDEHARCILGAASREPKSASELAEACGIATPTVYRRVKTLRERGLLEADLRIAKGGNHHEVFETTVERVSLVFDDGVEIEVRVARDFVDKFAALWEDLEHAGAEFGWGSSA